MCAKCLQVKAKPANEADTVGVPTMKHAVSSAKQAPPRSDRIESHLFASQRQKKGRLVSSIRSNNFEVNLDASLYARMDVTPINDSPTSE